jgi:L-lactate dehydrogenase complex protein LldG
MSARDEILGRVRHGVGKDDFAARRAAAEAWLSARTAGPQPALAGDLVERFRVKAEYLASTVAEVSALAEVPAAVAGYLTANGLGHQAVATPELGDPDWPAAGLAVEPRPAVDADTVGISGCFCAIAETGTLMLLSGPPTPATVSLLPETHIALVPVARIVATMEDAFALLRAEHGELPRAVNFISGPSRTGDIEQTIVLGAHGPCRVHLILIGEAS